MEANLGVSVVKLSPYGAVEFWASRNPRWMLIITAILVVLTLILLFRYYFIKKSHMDNIGAAAMMAGLDAGTGGSLEAPMTARQAGIITAAARRQASVAGLFGGEGMGDDSLDADEQQDAHLLLGMPATMAERKKKCPNPDDWDPAAIIEAQALAAIGALSVENPCADAALDNVTRRALDLMDSSITPAQAKAMAGTSIHP